jgi:hypothetical protein
MNLLFHVHRQPQSYLMVIMLNVSNTTSHPLRERVLRYFCARYRRQAVRGACIARLGDLGC